MIKTETMATTIERIIDAPAHHWVGNGFKVHGFLPQALGSHNRMSPFFLLDYNPKIHFGPSSVPRGVGVHPHRGMETVTIAYHGKVAHHDSAGNSGIISAGDVQWMTAGRGILHKEYQEQHFVEQGGDFQMVQLWVNLPAANKMTAPAYQGLAHSALGTYILPNDGGKISVIAGTYKGVVGPARTFTPIRLLDIRLSAGSAADFDFAPGDNAGMLVLEGSVDVNGEKCADANQFVLFARGIEQVHIAAKTDAVLLMMSGKPIAEPIVSYGPFLMNTEAEIYQAYEDFQKGMFGTLED